MTVDLILNKTWNQLIKPCFNIKMMIEGTKKLRFECILYYQSEIPPNIFLSPYLLWNSFNSISRTISLFLILFTSITFLFSRNPTTDTESINLLPFRFTPLILPSFNHWNTVLSDTPNCLDKSDTRISNKSITRQSRKGWYYVNRKEN